VVRAVAGCSDMATRAQQGGVRSGQEAREVAVRSTGAEVRGMQGASEVVCAWLQGAQRGGTQ
jgi:hypothetical protein